MNLKHLMLAILFFFLAVAPLVLAIVPTGPNKITNLSTVTAPVKSAFKINTSGGTFTTLLINVSSQTYRWKAYAGNVTGKITLDDDRNYTIYDWSLTYVTGEVYATRSSALVSWSNIICANSSTIAREQYYLNVSSKQDDSINKTFFLKAKNHDAFYVGSKLFNANSCPSISTYVSDLPQQTKFHEMAMYDGSSTVYATFLENKSRGFNNKYYDFQLILPESGLPGTVSPTSYYFYVEIS